MKHATERQKEFFNFIQTFITDNQYAPSIREIAGHFGISPKGAHDQVLRLADKGLIKYDKNRARTIQIVESGRQESDENQAIVPLLGHVAAGKPIFAEENHDGYLNLPRSMVGWGDLFALRVTGDSMIDAGILDGDIAVFVSQKNAENGQIVVAMVDDAVTLKRLYHEPNRVCLKAENPAFTPIYTTTLNILGRLVISFRSY